MNRLLIAAALVLGSTAAFAGNSYWEPSCAYVIGPRNMPIISSIGTPGLSKGRIACTECGKTTYTHDTKVLKGNHGVGNGNGGGNGTGNEGGGNGPSASK